MPWPAAPTGGGVKLWEKSLVDRYADDGQPSTLAAEEPEKEPASRQTSA